MHHHHGINDDDPHHDLRILEIHSELGFCMFGPALADFNYNLQVENPFHTHNIIHCQLRA